MPATVKSSACTDNGLVVRASCNRDLLGFPRCFWRAAPVLRSEDENGNGPQLNSLLDPGSSRARHFLSFLTVPISMHNNAIFLPVTSPRLWGLELINEVEMFSWLEWWTSSFKHYCSLQRGIFHLPLTKESTSFEWQLLVCVSLPPISLHSVVSSCEPHPQQEQAQQRAYTARKPPKRCKQENKAHFTNTQTTYLNFKQGIKSLTLF